MDGNEETVAREQLLAENQRLRDWLQRVATSTAAADEDWLDYVNVQIDRELWDELQTEVWE